VIFDLLTTMTTKVLTSTMWKFCLHVQVKEQKWLSSETLMCFTEIRGMKFQKEINLSYACEVFLCRLCTSYCYEPRKRRIFQLTIYVFLLITLFRLIEMEGRSDLKIRFTFFPTRYYFPFFSYFNFSVRNLSFFISCIRCSRQSLFLNSIHLSCQSYI
jgi:hypothetical protein